MSALSPLVHSDTRGHADTFEYVSESRIVPSAKSRAVAAFAEYTLIPRMITLNLPE